MKSDVTPDPKPSKSTGPRELNSPREIAEALGEPAAKKSGTKSSTPKTTAAVESKSGAKRAKSSKGGNGKGQFVRHPRVDDEEKYLAETVEPLFSDEAVRESAIRYGRKLLRKADGRRTSNPPLGMLSKASAAKVVKAMGDKLGGVGAEPGATERV